MKSLVDSHAQLVARQAKICGTQRIHHRLGPVCHFFEKQLWRPATPGDGAAANSEQQARVTERRVAVPRRAEIRRSALERKILRVLGQRERAGLQHENAPAASRIVLEQGGRHDGAERPAADDDRIESARFAAYGNGGAFHRLIEGIAQETAHVIERE